jgi:hypothetical protein
MTTPTEHRYLEQKRGRDDRAADAPSMGKESTAAPRWRAVRFHTGFP